MQSKAGRPPLPLESVLEGILFVLYEGCTWRAIDSPSASWNSIYQYWRRWCAEGIWAQLLELGAPSPKGKTRFLDSTHIKVHRAGCNPEGGQEAQGIGTSRGGLNTKLHAVVDLKANPLALVLSAGNEADISWAEFAVGDLQGGTLAADKGYDSDTFRCWLYEREIKPCIPSRSNRLEPLPYGPATYKKRGRVENFFERLKRYRRVATRYDKLAVTFLGFVQLAAALTLQR